MMKYGIEITKDNTETVIMTFDLSEKDTAMAYGENYFGSMKKGDGILTLFVGEFDEQGNRLSNEERICHVWY